MKKTCPRCGEEKASAEFAKNRLRPDGLSYHCKSCRRDYYLQNRDRFLSYQRKYEAEHKERRRTYNRLYYAGNADLILDRARETRLKKKKL